MLSKVEPFQGGGGGGRRYAVPVFAACLHHELPPSLERALIALA